MGDTNLYLLLLLSAYALADPSADVFDDETEVTLCPLSARFRTSKKYIYQYTAESTNGVIGTANIKNGPKISCKVEIDVPQTCSFVLHTPDCALSEMTDINTQGQPVYTPSSETEAFQIAMKKRPLHFVVEQVTNVSIYPEEDEPESIVNIKRGIISALLVPVIDKDINRKMTSIHGVCPTNLIVNERKDVDTDVTVIRDLKACSHFYPRQLPTSHLSLVPGLNGLITRLISSSQTCNYRFDNRKKHMTDAQCTESHIFVPFSHEAQYGINSEVKQSLILKDSMKTNNRQFSTNGNLEKKLFTEKVEDQSLSQKKEDMITTMKTLNKLTHSGKNKERANHFQKLVSQIRSMNNKTLSSAIEEMMSISAGLTWQVLLQCGTNECTSSILQILRSSEKPAWEVDVIVYSLSLLPQPTPQYLRDMLNMAEHRQSKPIMYALANTVKKFPHDQAMEIPEVKEVAEFMKFMLGDCSGDEDAIFLTLRVIGVMGKHMQGFQSLKSSLLSCSRQHGASLSVQKSAIQAFRLMDIDPEVTSSLLQVYQDSSAPDQKRIAAYLMLIRNLEVIEDVIETLQNEKNLHVKSFVASHIRNLLDTTDPNLLKAKDYITKALKSDENLSNVDFKFSHNYKNEIPSVVSVESNIIFDGVNHMPREVMLATTLDIFNTELLEIGVEGEGFEPTIEALFGENGFFPDTVSKAMYWANDHVSPQISSILKKWIAPLRGNRMKREIQEDIMRQIMDNVKKVKVGLKYLEENKDATNAMAYLRLLGTELGYIKTSELNGIIENIMSYITIFLKDNLSVSLQELLTRTDNEFFAHYMFLDKAFTLPTASGLPLKFSLAGIFTSSATGGLKFTHGMQHISFSPSVGVEFVTQMGIYVPEFMNAGIRMRSNVYHESSLNAKLSLSVNQVKLSLLVPKENIQLISISNEIFSLTSTMEKKMSLTMEDNTDSKECNPIFPGMTYCTILHNYNTPFYPLSGGSSFAVELQPSGDMSEYTVDVTYELLREDKEGHHKVDSVVFSLKTEGNTPAEATATFKYNRNKNSFSSNIQIPDFDVGTTVTLAVMDSTEKGRKIRGITVEINNKKNLQLSLSGRARLESMKDGMLELEVVVPDLQVNASAIVSLKNVNGLVVQLDTAFNIPAISTLQKAILRYDESKIELGLKSNVNSEVSKRMPDIDSLRVQLQNFIDDILDQQVTNTDMKLRHIVSKGIEAGYIWLDKFGKDIPYIRNLRSKRSIPELTLPSIPEKLYLKTDALFRYQFNKGKVFISLPVPLGGKSSTDLKIPSVFTLPSFKVPLLGLEVPETKHKIPSFTIPRVLDLSFPLLGMAEVSAQIKSNFYEWESSISGGNYSADVPSYIAKYKVMATCPLTPLSYKVEGTALMTGTFDDALKCLVNGSLNHSFLDASFSVLGSMGVSEKLRTVYKFEATSPFGLQTSLYCSSQSAFANNEITADTNADGVFILGPFYTNTNYTKTITINLLDGKGKGKSILKFDSSIIQGETVTSGEYHNRELSIVSRTSAQKGALKHSAEVKYKDGQLSLKSGATATAMGKTLYFQADFRSTMERANFKVETQVDDGTGQAFSVVMGSISGNGLQLNTDGSLNLVNCRSAHKGTLSLGVNGLNTNCTTTLLCSSLMLEKIFNAGIDRSGASLSLLTKGSSLDHTAELGIKAKITETEMALNSIFKGNVFENDFTETTNLAVSKRGLTLSNSMRGTLQKMRTESTHNLEITLWTLAFQSKTNSLICDGASYNHDIRVNMRPFVASMFTNCKLQMFDIIISKEGHLKVEPFKLDATGTITGQYQEDSTIKTTCAISLSELSGSVTCDSSGEALQSQFNHNLDLEFAGLSSIFKSETHLNLGTLRLENTIRTMTMPFSFTVDAILNSDGSVNFYGKHSGQVYSKFLLKAEPFAVAKSHDWRASITHQLPNGNLAETHLENKFDGLLIPNAQSFSWRFKSKLNNHAYNQNVSIFNKEADIGVQLSGVLQTNLFNTATESSDLSFDNQEFIISGFLKYDKNSNCHMIDLPFIESLPDVLEKMKTTVVSILESLQQYLNRLDITDLVRQFRKNLNNVPQRVSDVIKKIDIENKLNMAKDAVISLAQDYTVSLDDLEASLDRFMIASKKNLIDLATKIKDLKVQIKDFFKSEPWSIFLKSIGDELKSFDEKCSITRTILLVISAIEDIIRQIDLQKLHDKTWLKNLDAKYNVRAIFHKKLGELKQAIETFDVMTFVQYTIDYIDSNLVQYLDQLSLSDQIPAEDIERVIESLRDIIANWIDEYEIVDKINYVYLKIGELYQRYEIKKKMEHFIEQTVTLIKDYKIEKTVEAFVETLKLIPFEYYVDTVMQVLHTTVNKLKLIDIKQNFYDLFDYIKGIITYLKTFNYDTFVDEANEKISSATNYINEQINLYEIAQKIEASREYLKEIQKSIFDYMEQLKNTKVAEVYRIIKGVVDTTAYKDIKLKVQDMLEDMRQRISDMDIRDEILVYLEKASVSYTNIIDYIFLQFKKFINSICFVCKDQQTLENFFQTVEEVLNSLKMAKIDIPSLTIPYTTFQLSDFQINIDRLHDITIPSVITVPAFTVLKTIHVSSVTIDFEKIKQSLLEFIDQLRDFDIPELDPESTFGDLRVFYFFPVPDLTFPEIKLVAFRIPEVNIPKLSLEKFEITMLQIPEVKLPQIQFEPCIPAFGKLLAEVRLNLPYYTIMTKAAIQNTTTNSLVPQFKVTFSSEAKSTLQLLDYTLDAMMQIEAPKMEKLVISETFKANHMTITINHEGSLVFSGPSAVASAKTTAKVTTEMYRADLVNNLEVSLRNEIFVNMNTNHNHDINIPANVVSSQAAFTKTAEARVQSGTILVTCKNEGNWKWSVKDYSDEGVHKSNLQFSVSSDTAKLTFVGETNSNTLKMKQLVSAESVILSHFTIDVSAETETPFMKKNVIKLSGKAQMEDFKIELTANHNAELTGKVSGTISNSCDFLAQLFEIALDCKNKVNSKINFPLKLSGKLDLQHEYKMILNSENQYASCVALARFNQYKYINNFTLNNRETDAGIYASMDGEANLDFLTVPLTIPAMTVPFLDTKTPIIKDFSLWEDLGLKYLLTTSRQFLYFDFNLQYQKNAEKHTFDLDLEPIYSFIKVNSQHLGSYFEFGRDKIFDALTNFRRFEKRNVRTRKYFTIPGHTVPILNIKVSAFRAELPAVNYFIPKEVSTPSFRVPMMGFSVPSYTLVLPSMELPVMHVPETLRELTLPHFTLPDNQNTIMIPALGNFTFDFSFKSPVINVNSRGGLYNQSDIIVRLDASSTSVFEFLKGKLDGTSSITRKRCLKVATTLALEHKNAEYTHNSIFSVTKRNTEASLTNVIKLNLPVFTMDFNQKLNGNTRSKPNLASSMKFQYTYNVSSLNNDGKGIMDHDLQLETLSSLVSLESSLKGKIDSTFMTTGHFSESFNNEATIYLTFNGLHSTVKTNVTSEGDYKKTKLWNIDITKNFELKASLKRIYANFNYTNNNEVTIASIVSKGKHLATGSIEFVPLATLFAKVNIDILQPSSLGLASMLNNVDLAVSFDKQKVIWSSKAHILSLKHSNNIILSNNESTIYVELTESIEGHAAILKSIKVPIYQKTLWDVLKFDETTSLDKLQFLNVATNLEYTKSMDGTLFSIPAKVFDKGVIITIPEVILNIPDWLKQILQMIKEADERLRNAEVPEFISVPPVITMPSFAIPFTTAEVPFHTIDLQNLKIPNVIRVDSFLITLPSLPNIKIPSFEIDTKYVKNKMPFLYLNLPQYEVTISQFTLPKSFSIGKHVISLDNIVKAFCNFEMPTISVPEQKIEIPKISLYLPAGIFIPTFGALSTTIKISSPIYNNTWTAKMENKEPGFMYTLTSSSTSSMAFLGYDLEVIASVSFDNGAVSLDGKGTFSHSDVKVNMKHELHQNLRMKRDEPSITRNNRHTLDIDLTSQTFADMRFRYAAYRSGVTSSVSSPAGFVGFQFTKRSPSQYHGKFFTRSLSTPNKDTDLLTCKVTLKNSVKLNIQTSWHLNGFSELVNEFKARVPAITAVIHDFVNKYHKAHFGMDLNRATLKFKNAMVNTIEKAYSDLPKVFATMQHSVEHLSQQSNDILKRIVESMPEIGYQKMISKTSSNIRSMLDNYESKVKVIFDAIMKFLSETKFHLPGLEEKLTGQEIYYKVRRSFSMAIKRAVSRFTGLVETIADTVASYISGINFSIPGTNFIFNGRDMVKDLKSTLRSAQDRVNQAMRKWEGMKLEKVLQYVSDFIKLCIQMTREFITSLKEEKLRVLPNFFTGIFSTLNNTQVMQEIRNEIETTKTNVAKYKGKAQVKVQEIYSELTLEHMNSKISELITVLEKRFHVDVERYLEYAKNVSQHTQPYIKVTSKKVDVDIPLPFYWNSFSDWPSLNF